MSYTRDKYNENEESKMPLIFYPNPDDSQKGMLSLEERIEILMDAAERYKAVVLDEKSAKEKLAEQATKLMVPRDMVAAYNWEEIAHVLRGIRDLPEANKPDKVKKAEMLTKLAEVYEVLRAAKLAKLEAVRLALISEATQLRGGAQVA